MQFHRETILRLYKSSLGILPDPDDPCAVVSLYAPDQESEDCVCDGARNEACFEPADLGHWSHQDL